MTTSSYSTRTQLFKKTPYNYSRKKKQMYPSFINTEDVKILLVDDNPNNLFTLEALLTTKGRIFHKAQSGNEALRLALKHEYALIMLDVQMPNMDGYEVARYLKQNHQTKNTPILFVTASNRAAEDVIKGYEEGAVDYLFKPLNLKITVAKVNAYINFYLQQRQLTKQHQILQKWGTLVNNCADLMMILKSSELVVEEANMASLQMLGPDLITKSLLAYIPAQDIGKIMYHLQERTTIPSLELQVNCISGERKWLNCSFSGNNGKWYVNAKDITVRKKMELELKDAKKKSDQLLLNILPAEVAYELKENGFATPKSYEQVTILFTDFAGFTKISENYHPEQLIERLDECFLAFDEIISKYRLEKIKTIGDAYMCAGGIPVANDSHFIDAVSAGLEIQQFMRDWQKQQAKRNEPIWRLRLGIHTGTVVAGVVGTKKFAYDIWGDAVNTAARIESASEVGKVNISGATYHLIKDHFDCMHRGKIKAKNKGEIDMYFVEGLK